LCTCIRANRRALDRRIPHSRPHGDREFRQSHARRANGGRCPQTCFSDWLPPDIDHAAPQVAAQRLQREASIPAPRCHPWRGTSQTCLCDSTLNRACPRRLALDLFLTRALLAQRRVRPQPGYPRSSREVIADLMPQTPEPVVFAKPTPSDTLNRTFEQPQTSPRPQRALADPCESPSRAKYKFPT
jgi:hypothetical protein